jgi:putative membrane protein
MNHHVSPLTPVNLWQAWNFEPLLLTSLACAALIYLCGTYSIWQRAGMGHGIDNRRCLSFLGALMALLVAFVSPLDALSDVLFSAHMVQHMILILVVAPLLVLSDFHLALMWALPHGHARHLGTRWNQSAIVSRVWKVMTNPLFACICFAMVLWIWHATTLYEAALQNEWVHSFEHLALLGTAMLFWWVLLKPVTQKLVHYGMAIPYLFATVLQSTILGALMTFTSEAWYPYYASFVTLWGLTPLQDQQFAGLIMWVPGGAIFTILTIAYFTIWLRALEHHSLGLQKRDVFQARQELK